MYLRADVMCPASVYVQNNQHHRDDNHQFDRANFNRAV
jgi:hypothetical protein